MLARRFNVQNYSPPRNWYENISIRFTTFRCTLKLLTIYSPLPPKESWLKIARCTPKITHFPKWEYVQIFPFFKILQAERGSEQMVDIFFWVTPVNLFN